MKNLFKLIGIAAIVTVIGFSMIACDNGSSPTPTPTASINGTWVNDDDGYELKIDDGSFEMIMEDSSFMKGTVTTSGRNFTMTITDIHGNFVGLDSRWYTKDDLQAASLEGTSLEGASEEDIDSMFLPMSGTYSDSRLTVTTPGRVTFTKQ